MSSGRSGTWIDFIEQRAFVFEIASVLASLGLVCCLVRSTTLGPSTMPHSTPLFESNRRIPCPANAVSKAVQQNSKLSRSGDKSRYKQSANLSELSK
eukprot:3380414-Amphidinium_carterae.1